MIASSTRSPSAITSAPSVIWSKTRAVRRVPHLLQTIGGAIETHAHLRPVRIDRAGGSHGVLTLERVKNVSWAETEVRQPGIGELDEDALRALALDVDFLDA